jgi:putative tricarboxylic transport membrane protein
MSDAARPATPLNNTELWGGVFGLGLAVFTTRAGWSLGVGSVNDPGSGFMLFYVGLLMCVLAAALIISAFTDGGPTFASRWSGARWTKPLVVIASLAGFAVALDIAGFLISAIVLLLLLLRLVDPVRWSVAIPVGVLSPLIVWWVLKKGLLIQLPSGLFGVG